LKEELKKGSERKKEVLKDTYNLRPDWKQNQSPLRIAHVEQEEQ